MHEQHVLFGGLHVPHLFPEPRLGVQRRDGDDIGGAGEFLFSSHTGGTAPKKWFLHRFPPITPCW